MIEMANQNGFGLIAIALDIIAIELCLIDSTRYNIAGGWVCLIASWVVILWGDIMKITLQETLRVSYITVTFSKDSKLTPENHQKWAKHLKKF